jgi:hypothetical protein
MEIGSIIINACITIFSLGLLIVSLLSYWKYKNVKLVFVSLVFLVLFIKGILLSIGIFYNDEISQIFTSPYIGMFDLIILILLFIATLKR